MKDLILCLGALVLVLIAPASGPATSANIVVNGSFEVPSVGGGVARFFGPIPGWSLSFGSDIEVQGGIAGSAFDGSQLVELDGIHPSGIVQNLPTTTGQAYELRFAFSPRPGLSLADNILQVKWEGTIVDTLSADGSGLTDTNWSLFTYHLTATSGTTPLEFRDLGIDNTGGTYIDAVSVRVIPEPSTLVLLGIGIAGLLVAAHRRREKFVSRSPEGNL